MLTEHKHQPVSLKRKSYEQKKHTSTRAQASQARVGFTRARIHSTDTETSGSACVCVCESPYAYDCSRVCINSGKLACSSGLALCNYLLSALLWSAVSVCVCVNVGMGVKRENVWWDT